MERYGASPYSVVWKLRSQLGETGVSQCGLSQAGSAQWGLGPAPGVNESVTQPLSSKSLW